MSNEKGKISVIMGIYNCADTLGESIESIINQTYSNWELIMCNDGSTDNTLDVANFYKNIDNRIRVIENEVNKGLAYSLNRCIDIAEGEYIARHDGDDICIQDRFERQINFIRNNDFELVGSAVEYFDSQKVWGKDILKATPDKVDVFYKSMFSHPTILIKKDVINDVGNYTISNITTRTEDYDLFSKLYAKGYRGYNIQDVLLKVRRDNDAYKRRKFKYRIDESICKFNAWKRLKLNIKYIPFVIVPIIKGLIPYEVFKIYHKLKYSRS